MSRSSCALLIGLLLTASSAGAFTVERSATRYADRQYQCELTLTLAAPIERVEAVLRDYERYPTLDPRILDARVIGRPAEDVALLTTTVRACFGPFCRNVKRLERVQEGPRALDAYTDASRSDVKLGVTSTRLEAMAGGTRVRYSTRITPDFWIPPLVGRRWMLRTLEESTLEIFRNVEERAGQTAED